MPHLNFIIAIIAIISFCSTGRAAVRHTIVVNKWDNTLKYYQTGQPARQFRVATGLYKCTPEGRFRIIQKSVISQHGRGQFGTRWLGLNTLGKRGWYRIGIHGTNEPKTIGKYASKACVRMLNSEINWLYERVPYGTTVRIINVPVRPQAAGLSLTKVLNVLSPRRIPIAGSKEKGSVFVSPSQRREEHYTIVNVARELWWFGKEL